MFVINLNNYSFCDNKLSLACFYLDLSKKRVRKQSPNIDWVSVQQANTKKNKWSYAINELNYQRTKTKTKILSEHKELSTSFHHDFYSKAVLKCLFISILRMLMQYLRKYAFYLSPLKYLPLPSGQAQFLYISTQERSPHYSGLMSFYKRDKTFRRRHERDYNIIKWRYEFPTNGFKQKMSWA